MNVRRLCRDFAVAFLLFAWREQFIYLCPGVTP
jgi:hypothetical protein